MKEKETYLFILAISFCLIYIFFSACALAFIKEPDGFNDIRWGMRIDALKDMEYMFDRDASGDIKVYKRAGDLEIFGGAKIDSIEYDFFRGTFVSVKLKIKDLYNFVIMKNFLFKEYGPKEPMSDILETFVWNGDKSKMVLYSNYEIS